MSDFTPNYLRANAEQTKRISLVVNIEGIAPLSNTDIFSAVKYGDPGLTYGQPGLVYGALKRQTPEDGGPRSYLSLEGSSLTISQRIEPEQGRGSVSTLSLSFIDKDGYMTQVISPGVLVPEILGRKVTVELGYQDVSYPEDYFTVFRGYVTAVDSIAGMVNIQISDANFRRRQNVFFSATTNLASGIDDTTTTIPAIATSDFFQQILGPDGNYDPGVRTFIQIEDEYIEYPSAGIVGDNFVGCTRGARDTVPVAHDAGEAMAAFVELEDNAIQMALKIMLSGWNGDWLSDVAIKALARTLDGTLGDIPNAITFPDGIDVERDYGLVPGDYVTVSGSVFPGNNVITRITDILDIGESQPNQVILVEDNFTIDFPTLATVAFRSQFDTYPVECGAMLTPDDVDVAGHLEIQAQFLSDAENDYRFFIGAPQAAKTFIEMQIYLPVSAYAVTRFGRLSVRITKPPLASTDLQILSIINLLDPDKIRLSRATNSRSFFNQITFNYDADDSGNFKKIFTAFDSDSVSLVQFVGTLPISSLGARSEFSADDVFARRAQFFLSRYKRGATEVTCKVNWGVGNLIEAGDVVALNGAGLFLSNFVDGTRIFGTQLFEVVNRDLDIKTGNVSLKLISGVGASATDRFGTVSPSTNLASGSTVDTLRIEDSYSRLEPKFPGREWQKWQDYVGQPIRVHSEDYTFDEETLLAAIDPVSPYTFRVAPSLSVPPPSGYVIDIANYPDATETYVNSLYKSVHFFLSPRVDIVTGLSDTEFQVGVGEVAKFFDGCMVRVHNADFSRDAPETAVTSITGTTLTVQDSLGFTPNASDFIELIGFADHGGSYRVI